MSPTRARDERGLPEGSPGDPGARAFGAMAREYERNRPTYPESAVAWTLVTVPPGARVLDAGAGTGKLSRVVLGLGYEVVASDVDPGMIEELRLAVPGVPAVVAPTEDLPFEDAGVDAALVAQAWHWMDHEAAGVELARVVRPGGTVGLLWNTRDIEDPLQVELSAAVGVVRDYERRDAEPIIPHAAFGARERRTVDSTMRMRPEDLVAMVATWSHVALDDRRDAILARVGEIGRAHADTDGTVRYVQSTHCHRFPRR